MMSIPERCAPIQKETHHAPMIQEAITFHLRVQVLYCVLSEVSISDLQRCNCRICQTTSLSVVQTERASRGNGVECATGPCTSGGVDPAEICSIGIHGIPGREDGITAVPAVRKSRVTILGTPPVGERLLCEHNWIGRGEDTQVCAVARETRKAK